MIAGRVEIKEHGTGNVAGEIFRQSIAAGAGEVPRSIDDLEARGPEPISQPLRRDQVGEVAPHAYAATALSTSSSAGARPRRVYRSKNAAASSKSLGSK